MIQRVRIYGVDRPRGKDDLVEVAMEHIGVLRAGIEIDADGEVVLVDVLQGGRTSLVKRAREDRA